MEINLPLNESFRKEFEVTPERTAVHVGSGSVSVLSTPSMILFMEQTARIWAQKYLPEGYTTVGTHVCIDHLKAVGLNQIVIAEANLINQENKKIEFEVTVKHNNTIIGKGKHIRFIVDEKRFLQNI